MKTTILFFCLLTLGACKRELSYLSFSGSAFKTTYSVKLINPIFERVGVQELQKEVEELLAQIEKLEKEVMAFNQLAQADQEVAISSDLFKVLEELKRINEFSGGAYDFTIGKLGGVHGLHFNGDKITIKKDSPEIFLDLSLIFKGLALDKIALLFEGKKIENFMIKIGEEVRAKGLQGLRPWKVVVSNSKFIQDDRPKILPLENMCMTSASNEQKKKLDPRSGRPIDNDIISVTVLHPSCMNADAMSAVLMVLGREQGIALANKHGISAYFVYLNSEKKFQEEMSLNFKQFASKNK